MHFIHSKAAKGYKTVYPVLVVHGWPGCVFEFYKFIPILNDPKVCPSPFFGNPQAHGINVDFAFDVIAPSIPGYGWSEAPKKTGKSSKKQIILSIKYSGFSQVSAARVFKKLMLRLDHQKFYLQGGDWGSIVTRNLAGLYPEKFETYPGWVCSVHALHLNMAASGLFEVTPRSLFYNIFGPLFHFTHPNSGSLFPQWFFASEHYHGYNFLSNIKNLIIESGYMHIQATKPDTVGRLDFDPMYCGSKF